MNQLLFTTINDFTLFIQNKLLLMIDSEIQEPSVQAISKTFAIIEALYSLSIIPSHVGPSVESGIGITLDSKGQFAYIEVLNIEEIVFLMDTNGKNMQVWETNFNEAEEIDMAIKKIFNHLTFSLQE